MNLILQKYNYEFNNKYIFIIIIKAKFMRVIWPLQEAQLASNRFQH